MQKLFLYFNTLVKLGIPNVIYVFWYRISLKCGIRKYYFKQKEFKLSGDFFQPTEIGDDYPEAWKHSVIVDAERIIKGEIRYFAYHWKNVYTPPNWFLNPFNNKEYPNRNLHWTKLPDFNASVGDIKNIWEASRFEWVVTLSRAYAVTGDLRYLITLNNWISDWINKNPLNTGPNWKCGQEAAIRVFNLINATNILKQTERPTQSLTDLIYFHLERINNNILYAIAQDNNHGTSEAAGLFIGGIFLSKFNFKKYPKTGKYAKNGRYWLEKRVSKLIEADGSFSQHSVTYHRVMLDTLCFAEFWKSKLNVKNFSTSFYKKAEAATHWLELLSDKESGDAPNLGSNDGALLLNVHSCSYRDFRPTLQLARRLFVNSSGNRSSNELLDCLDLENERNTIQRHYSSITLKSGYTFIYSRNSWALVRWPYFRFRPSHNDVMHFDLWFKGRNVICDSGTYSYNPTSNEIQLDYKSVHFHNTVSFDGKEQMPKIGRFLFGKWLKAGLISEIQHNNNGSQEWFGSYKDNHRNYHSRCVKVSEDNWEITDTLSGTFVMATIGFNIPDIDCKLNGYTLETSFGSIKIPENSVPFLVDSSASLHYWEQHPLKRLSIEISKPGIYTTIIELK